MAVVGGADPAVAIAVVVVVAVAVVDMPLLILTCC